MTDTILRVSDLNLNVASDAGINHAVKALNLSITKGQTFALVGESGCGKSLTAMSLLKLLPDAVFMEKGTIQVANQDISNYTDGQMRSIRGGQIGMVFQEPATSLNPVMNIGSQISEVLRQHTDLRGKDLQQRIIYWLDKVGIPNAQQRIYDYPFQFSGGQKQRIMIAIALAAEPKVLVADEPTTALDVTVQAQILDLLASIQDELGLAILLITHDLAVVRKVAHHVALMRSGEILLTQSADDFFNNPSHEYAQELLAAIPTLNKRGRFLTTNQSKNKGINMKPSESTQQIASHENATVNAAHIMQTAEIPEILDSKPVLSVKNLSVSYLSDGGFLSGKPKEHHIVKDVSFDLRKGETLALLGESGCGKTTVAKSLLRLLDENTKAKGQVLLHGNDVLTASGTQLKEMRKQMQIVFQDPYASLNPRMQIGEILDEGLNALKPETSSADKLKHINYILDRVGLPSNTRSRYPHEFSGGQRQRIAIARALALEPDVLVCDEPTSALDVSVQAQLLDLLEELQQDFGIAYLFITHNFGVVEYLSDRIAIMDNGQIVEVGDTLKIIESPQHEKTKELFASVPRL